MRRRALVLTVWCVGVLVLGCGGSNAAASDSAASQPRFQPLAQATEPASTADAPETPAEGMAHCEQLATRLCAHIEPATCAFARERIGELDERRCAVMNDHYAEVLDDLQRCEAEQRPLPADRLARAISGATASIGPEGAPVTLILFSDFQCPFCAGAAAATHSIVTRYGDRVRLVFRQFPLPFHPHAHVAAEAALAAAAEGKFWPMHDQLFAHQDALDREALTRYAKEIGLDTAAFSRALEARTYAPAVDADVALGMDLAVNGTPTMFLNGVRVPNASDVDLISARIDAALAPATTPSPDR